MADTIKRLQANRAVLRREGIAGVSVFGSVAHGDASEDSDIDLLIEPAAGTSVSGLMLVRWKKLMSELLGRDADVVVREFLGDKVRETIERDLIEVVFNRAADAKKKPKRPKPATKDRFGEELLKLKGSIDPTVKLEFDR